MNSADVHERRRVAASILRNKLRVTHLHENHLDRDPLTRAADVDDYEFMDDSMDQQQVDGASSSSRVDALFATQHCNPNLIGRFAVAKPSSNKSHLNKQSSHQVGNGKGHGNHTERSGLKTLIEEERAESVIEVRRLAGGGNQNHVRGRVSPSKNGASVKSTVHANGSSQLSDDNHNLIELANDFKRRLSLPNETPIPDSFLLKHRAKLDNLAQAPPLSRLDRRRSLLDIGFGKSGTYSKLHVLGAGTYSIVYKGVSRLTDKVVALKEINLERDEGVPFTAIREISLLKQLKHSNIITLHDVIYTRKTLTLVFEFVDRDLSRYMDECDYKMDLNNVKLYLFQLLRALKYCHDKKILHRDIKPQNILISLAGELKLADFGLARAKSFPTKTYTDEVVTLWYRPPDVLLGNVDYGTCIDMWGVGCIFFEMATGHTLFVSTAARRQIECIFEILGTPSETDWPGIGLELKYNDIDAPYYEGRNLGSMAARLDEEGVELLRSLLKCNPRQRISAGESLQHKYFASLPQAIHKLPDTESIFSLASVELAKEQLRAELLASIDDAAV